MSINKGLLVLFCNSKFSWTVRTHQESRIQYPLDIVPHECTQSMKHGHVYRAPIYITQPPVSEEDEYSMMQTARLFRPMRPHQCNSELKIGLNCQPWLREPQTLGQLDVLALRVLEAAGKA